MNMPKRNHFDSHAVKKLKPLSDINACIKDRLRQNGLTCKSDVKPFHGGSNISLHIQSEKMKPNEITFKCVICEKCFKLEKSLVKHLASHSHMIPIKCGICQELCSSSKQLIQHSLLHSKKVFKPDKHSNTNRSISVKISHTKENSFACNFCPKVFMREKSFKTHMSMHSKETFVCSFCEKNFLFENRLMKHLQTVHCITNKDGRDSIPENKLLQSISKTKCIRGGNFYTSHSTSEVNYAIDSCILCNENFSTSYELGLHLIQHAEEYEKSCASSNSCDDCSDIEIID